MCGRRSPKPGETIIRMTFKPPIRLTGAMLATFIACSSAVAAPRAEESLRLDPELRSADGERTLQTPEQVLVLTHENERPLYLSQGIAYDASDIQALEPAPAKAPPSDGTRTNLLNSFLQAIALLASGLLGLHLLIEWLRVVRLRVHRPPRSTTLEHARWPTLSILIPARGSPAHQIERLRALAVADFDYPAECIHFVPMFDPSDTDVAAAVTELGNLYPGKVHPLPMMAGPNTTLAAALHAAVANSIGSALIVLDQELPLPSNWLRTSITPLLDPAVGSVLTRAVLSPEGGTLSSRLDLLADQADTLLATQSDALRLLLCGKARIRALRRQAIKSLQAPDLLMAPDGASLVLALTRLGWQSSLLGEITRYTSEASPDLIRSPRLHPSLALQSMRLVSLLLDARIPAGARRQGGAAFFSAALPLIWLTNLLCGIALYFTGAPLSAGLIILLCTATSFDPHGNPGPAFRIAAAARMAGAREEIRLLPLTWLGFTHRILDGLRLLAFARREARREHAMTALPVKSRLSEEGAQA